MKSSKNSPQREGGATLWAAAGVLALFVVVAVCLVAWLAGESALRPGEDPASGSPAGSPTSSEVASADVSEAASAESLELRPGDEPLRSLRKVTPATDSRSLARPLESDEWNAAAYSRAVLPKEVNVAAGESAALVVSCTGSRITHSLIEKEYHLSSTPDETLELPQLTAKARRDRMGVEVLPFTQLPSRGLAGISDVENAGEILALAVARQLSQMECRVQLKLNDSMGKRLRAAKTDKAAVTANGGLESVLRRVWEKLDFRFELSGSVRCWIVQREEKGGGTVTAYLAVLPAVSVDESAGEQVPDKAERAVVRKLYQPPPIFEQEVLAASGSSAFSALRKEATRRVLERGVTRLLGAPQLEKTLVSYIEERDAVRSSGDQG